MAWRRRFANLNIWRRAGSAGGVFFPGVSDVPGRLVAGHIPGLAAARSYDDRDLDPLNRGFCLGRFEVPL
jgi:hypothetical protein